MVWTRERDELLQARYDCRVPGRVEDLARSFGCSVWAVKRRASQISAGPHNDYRIWTPAQIAFLERNVSCMAIAELARRLGRTAKAVEHKKTALGLGKMRTDGYTAEGLGLALGVSSHWVAARIRGGRLPCRMRQTTRDNDVYLITDEDVMQMVINHPLEIDLHKIDQVWFMDLVAMGFRKLLNGRAA